MSEAREVKVCEACGLPLTKFLTMFGMAWMHDTPDGKCMPDE